jgi:hypothetical protein
MLAIGLLRWRDQPSWVFLDPGLLLGLTPSALVANSNAGWIRLTFVAAVATMVIGTRFPFQASFIIGATILAKIVCGNSWRSPPHPPLDPSAPPAPSSSP